LKLGEITWARGNASDAHTLIEESLALSREVGDKVGIADALCSLADMSIHFGEYTRARSLLEEGLALFKELGDKRGIAYTLLPLALAFFLQGDSRAARPLAEESLTISRQGFAPVVIPVHLKIDVCLACTSIDMDEVSFF